MDELIWRKSSRSYDWQALKCVSLAVDGDVIWVRNSNDPDGPRVAFTPEEMDAFLRGVQDGEFDDLLLAAAA